MTDQDYNETTQNHLIEFLSYLNLIQYSVKSFVSPFMGDDF